MFRSTAPKSNVDVSSLRMMSLMSLMVRSSLMFGSFVRVRVRGQVDVRSAIDVLRRMRVAPRSEEVERRLAEAQRVKRDEDASAQAHVRVLRLWSGPDVCSPFTIGASAVTVKGSASR